MRPQPSSPARALFLVGAAAFLLAVGTTVVCGLPEPAIHDEHSYLLQAETFARGRLTNPPLERPHFESLHVLSSPTRASKYPPGQAIRLAVGVLLGHPIVGVWLGIAGAAMAVTWMLRAAFPSRRATFGGLLVAFLLGLPNYWVLGYWGGSVAAIGGALVFGATARLLGPADGARRWAAALALGVGWVVLANSRPLEGVLVCLPLLGILAADTRRRVSECPGSTLRPLLVATGGIFALGLVATAIFDRAVTGDPFVIPYQAYNARQPTIPQFVWMDLPPFELPAPEIHRRWVGSLRARFLRLQDPLELLGENVDRLFHSWRFFVGWTLLLPYLAALRARGPTGRQVRLVLSLFGLHAIVLSGFQSFHPHYVAALLGPGTLLAVAGLEVLETRFRIRRAAVAGAVLLALVAIERVAIPDPYLRDIRQRTAPEVRAGVDATLTATGGRHLVLVFPLPDADIHESWVFNGPDLGAETVLWAHSISPSEDLALASEHADRALWLLRVGKDPRRAELAPFVPAAEPSLRPSDPAGPPP